jgi:hypothetical protein
MLAPRMKKQWMKLIVVGSLIIGSISSAFAAWNSAFYLTPALQYSSYYIDDLKFQGMNLRLGAGVAGMTDCYYIAAEIFALPFTATINNNPTFRGSLKTSYSSGVSLIPGYYFDDSIMGYLRLSYVSTRFENIGTTKSGYEIGGGVDVGWTRNWSVFGEYDFAKYQRINKNNLGSPRAGFYILGLKYKFV